MVSTRHHPRQFPAPPSETSSPAPSSSTRSKSPPSSRRSNAKSPTRSPTRADGAASPTPASRRSTGSSSRGWAHTPSFTVLAWLVISVPVVLWDCAFVLGRPYTMGGGWLNWPVFVPYNKYVHIDYTYGWPALATRDGFGFAQGAMNIIECALSLAYLYLVAVHGEFVNRGGRTRSKKASSSASEFFADLSKPRRVAGREGALALVFGYSAAVMTISKTILYFLNEYYTGFKNIGHNDVFTLFVFWIFPNGVWLIFPSYLVYEMGTDIVEGLDGSYRSSRKSE